MKRLSLAAVALAPLAALVLFFGATAAGDVGLVTGGDGDEPEFSGVLDFKDVTVGAALTGCPQAGRPLDLQPKPLDVVAKDKVEQLSNGGNDVRVNQDFACRPQDETSIAVNPTNQRNIIAGANDYRLGWGSSGFYSSTDNGNHWYDGIKIFPSPTNGDDHINGGGDPAVVFDRAGVAYYADIHFERLNDTSGVFVGRSLNGGFTWSQPCVAFPPSSTAPARCGGNGDVRTPGDGVVSFDQDPDSLANNSVPFNDKEYIAAGPRPAGVAPQCFDFHHAPTACTAGTVGVDRLYVTWTLFIPLTPGNPASSFTSPIVFSFSDDQGRSWSPRRVISGTSSFCEGFPTGSDCNSNQFSTPTVSPATGAVYVSFENFNTENENQYLLVRSTDGGATWQGPFFVSPVFDVNYPRSGTAPTRRNDCAARGQGSGRRVLSNSCFRVNAGGNVVVDKRGGAFADDLYLVFSDNRNGTRASTNTDVFLFKSTDGGTTWVGPTRVNDDPSLQPTTGTPPVSNRSCAFTDVACQGVFGNDQWYPWVDIGARGDVNVVFEDRRLDTNSTAGEWPLSRTPPNGRPGNYLVWFWGAVCSVAQPDSRECVAPTAQTVTQPTVPINPGNVLFPNQTVFPFRNFGLSDTPSNWDYTFRAGIFAGDYSGVNIGPDNQAWAFWTDARNGRSSRSEPGRNPLCEQSDVFADSYSARTGGSENANSATQGMDLYLVTPCPTEFIDKGSR